MSDVIRVVIADDHPIFRHGLRQIIEADPHLTVVAEASDGQQAYRALAELGPAVAVLDLTMPLKDGFEVARAARDARLPTALVFLTMHKDEHYLKAALEVGAKGYVLKDSAVSEIVGCIRAVAAGQEYISPALSSLLIRRSKDADMLARERPVLDRLTPTERRILKLIAHGLTSRAIADSLNIGLRTVEHHRNNVAAKLGLQGSHALVKFAVKHESQLG
ncbi:MAG: response regulator [Luteitalea sp.]|nr:response regulator [Luteitalea sp.]